MIKELFLSIDKHLPCQNQKGFMRSKGKCYTYQKSYSSQMAPKYVQRDTRCQGDGTPCGELYVPECGCEMYGPTLLW